MVDPAEKEVSESSSRHGRYRGWSAGDPFRNISFRDRWCSIGIGVLDVLLRWIDILFSFRLSRFIVILFRYSL